MCKSKIEMRSTAAEDRDSFHTVYAGLALESTPCVVIIN